MDAVIWQDLGHANNCHENYAYNIYNLALRKVKIDMISNRNLNMAPGSME